MPLVALVALFIVVPLAELYVILKVGDAIGAVPTILLLAADSIIGALLLRAQGRSVWARFNVAVTAGRMPHREVVDGVLVIFGGAFLITPGFLTDILGLVLADPAHARARARNPAAAAGAPGGGGSDGDRPRARTALRRGRDRNRARRPVQAARPVSSAPYAFSFFDPDRKLYGMARSGATILFDDRNPAAHAGGPEIEPAGEGWRAHLDDRFSLELAPLLVEVELGAVTARVCRVTGEVGGRGVECLGVLAHTHEAPRWQELDAVRSICALVDEGTALLALAHRPRDAAGHGDEAVRATLISDGELLVVEEARISTVYDSGGRQRSAGLELWVAGEEFSRRGSGQVIAGSSLDLDEIQVHAAVFRWRLDGREAIGAYELMVRAEPRVAA